MRNYVIRTTMLYLFILYFSLILYMYNTIYTYSIKHKIHVKGHSYIEL